MYIFVSTQTGMRDNVNGVIQKIPGVKRTYPCSHGPHIMYDISVCLQDTADVNATENKIKQIEGVTKTDVLAQ